MPRRLRCARVRPENYVGHCIVKFLECVRKGGRGGGRARSVTAAATASGRQGTIGGSGSIDERRTKWIFLRTVPAGGRERRRAAMLADMKGTAPDSRFHWPPTWCRSRERERTGYRGVRSILSSAGSPRTPRRARGSPVRSRVCARPIYAAR